MTDSTRTGPPGPAPVILTPSAESPPRPYGSTAKPSSSTNASSSQSRTTSTTAMAG